MRQITIGADPEVFVKNKKGVHISAYGMIEGDKANPFKVDKGAVQVDGMALEFNIDPAKTCEEFVDSIYSVMGTLQGMIKDEISIVPVAEFGKKYIDKQPNKATELGCDPDFNAYTGVQNPVPDGNSDFRTAAGHIHVGWGEGFDISSEDHMNDCIYITKALDNVLFVLSNMWDTDEKRRELYGQRGSFRPKSYGMEYRVLSNAWLKHPAITEFVYKLTTHVMQLALNGTLLMRNGLIQQGSSILRRLKTQGGFSDYMEYCGVCYNESLYISYVKCYEAINYAK